LSEEIYGPSEHGEFTWKIIHNYVTPREWDYIVRRVEERLREYKLVYVETLKKLTYEQAPHAISYTEYIAKGLEWNGDVFAPWQTRAIALAQTRNIPIV
jgi:hypothetical protein